MANFIGRAEQLGILSETLESQKATLVVIRGRRRIGKSRLIDEFSKQVNRVYTFSGLAPDVGIGQDEQRREFIRQMAEQQIASAGHNDWGDLFFDLAQYCKSGRCVVVLDEITWMAMDDPTFMPKLKNAWDMHFKKNPELILIISGSDSAWIENNILSKTGFFGRVTIRMKLDELSLPQCAEFWGSYKDHISAYEMLKVLSITGGIPRYLEEINPRITAEENIFRLCYRAEGVLFNEFDDIFNDLFQRRGIRYKELIHCVARGEKTLDDIARALNRKKGGDLTRALVELCQDGFLARDHSWNFKTGTLGKVSQYRLRDNYLRYYLKYIQPYKQVVESGEMENLPAAWDTIIALAFENLVVNNRKTLHRLLNIPANEIVRCNPYLQTETKQSRGCQIDYLIQTKHDTLYLCEVKFSKHAIDRQVR